MDSENVQKKSNRIALIASEHTFSQYPVFLKHLLIGLADESIPAALVCPQRCNVESLVIGAVEIIRYPVLELPFAGYFNNKLLLEQLMKFKPTILHCLCESQAEETKYLAESLNLPYVLMVNSLHKHFSISSSAGKNLPISHVHCKKIITPMASITSNYTKTYPHYADIVQQVNHGTFTTVKTSCFSQTANYITIVMAYPASYCENIENIFNSIRHLKIDGYEFMIFLISSDSLHPRLSFFTKRSVFPAAVSKTENQLWKLLNALDLARFVTMVPSKITWRKVLASGDIFIYPCPCYVFNSILLEAMSVGTAIAAAPGGVDDLIIADETAVIFDNFDEPGIMQTLRKLIVRPEFARQIAKNAQQYVKRNHSVSNMIAQILQIYNEAGS
ncbi:MAG: glycosyltransferase family 4 protein [Sedimentisphaerales bacterium]|nr:glycosyltransferase family 4 protein [Sedimentisphaerales bacterium]